MAEPKKFALRPDEIKPLAEERGAAFATDYIMVDGQKVGYLYRVEPEDEEDSGWCFMAGHETQEYMDNPENLGLYDVNTIANYDPEIIPLLDAPYETAYARNEETGEFEEVEFEGEEE